MATGASLASSTDIIDIVYTHKHCDVVMTLGTAAWKTTLVTGCGKELEMDTTKTNTLGSGVSYKRHT